jgi:hypothetical protein
MVAKLGNRSACGLGNYDSQEENAVRIVGTRPYFTLSTGILRFIALRRYYVFYKLKVEE